MDLSSGQPYWVVKSGLPYDYPKLEKDAKAEIVIMGGGISGALVCYYLTNAGIDCLLIDSRTIGLGSTSASTALLQYEIDVPLHKLIDLVGEKKAIRSYKLCEEAIFKLEEITNKLKFELFEYKKSLYYAAFKKDIDLVKREYETRKQNGFKVKLLDEQEIFKSFNFKAPVAILSETAAQTNPYLLTHTLLQNSISNGSRVYDRTNVININHQKAGVKLITEEGNTITAKKLIYATGYEAVNYIDKKIVDLHSTYAIASEHLEKDKEFWLDNALIWNTASPYLYMRTTYDSRIIIGGRDEDFSNAAKRDKLLKIKAKLLEKDFTKIFPHIPFKTEFSWTGTFGETKDGLPFIGNYSKLPNSYFTLGFGGNGITFSLIAAEIIRDEILGKVNKDSDLFSFNRV